MAFKGRPASWDERMYQPGDYRDEGPRPATLTAGLLVVLVVIALVGGVIGGSVISLLRPASSAPPGGGDTFDATFELKAFLAGFRGIGGTIDGLKNPDLRVKQGDKVQVTVSNGEASTHNWYLEQYAVQIQDLAGAGARGSAEFTADTAGNFEYFCTIPGHKEAGMKGTFIVGAGGPAMPPAKTTDVSEIAHRATDLPPPLTRATPATVDIFLGVREVVAEIEPGTTFSYWTYNGTVPGPFFRVMVGDTVVVHFSNPGTSTMDHSVDFHAVTGPGGGMVATMTPPGQTSGFQFRPLTAGLFVYHCASPHIPTHISSGMYGLILVEPVGGLPPVDKEFYVMQGDIYTKYEHGNAGHQAFDGERLAAENPTYVVFNGRYRALTGANALTANVNQTVRIFFGVGGPNLVSSFHVIGEIFDRVYNLADLLSPPLQSVQTVLVPPGGATVVEFKVEIPGNYVLVDHSLSRTIDKGSLGILAVTGPEDHTIFWPP